MNREQWLNEAINHLRPIFKTKAGIELPANIKVTVSFALNSKTAIGQAFPEAMSKGGYREILICPTQDNAVQVLGILTHEVIHAWDNNKSGHKGAFANVAKAMGFKTPLTKLNMGPELVECLNAVVESMPPYPHASLSKGARTKKKQSTRMIKLECLGCDFICRASSSAILNAGVPTCGCGSPMRPVPPKMRP